VPLGMHGKVKGLGPSITDIYWVNLTAAL
jgi:hypothetical protein